MKIGTDKMLHFIVSLLVAIVASTLAATAIYNLNQDNPALRTGAAYGIAMVITLSIGTLKECRDSKQAGNHFCPGDLVADLAGAALGSLGAFVSYLI